MIVKIIETTDGKYVGMEFNVDATELNNEIITQITGRNFNFTDISEHDGYIYLVGSNYAAKVKRIE